MTGFLNVLAGMALGVQPAGTAQVSLPSRFAPASSAWESEPAGLGESRLGEEVEQTERRSALLQSDRSDGRNAPETERVPPEGLTAPKDRPRQQPATSAVSNVREAPPTALLPPNVRKPTRAALPDDGVAQPADVKPSAQIDHGEPQPFSNRHPVSASPAMQSASRYRADVPQAPLSDAALAGRSIASRERPSIVQVTIDRIDVRAPSSPATPRPQRRVQPQPTVSLSDYLRDGAKAGRP
jgi:hypothetical protein